MARVFISHSSRDRRFIEQELVPLLTAHDIDYWYSTEHIETAQKWEAAILSGLVSCDYFAIVISQHSLASHWVGRELDWALSYRAEAIIPILLRDHVASGHNLKLEAIQHVDYSVDRMRARRRLLEVWGRTLRVRFQFRHAVRSIWFACRGVHWRQLELVRNAAWSLLEAMALATILLVAAQDSKVRALKGGVPLSSCRVEAHGSAVELFEHGTLIAKHADAVFYAISEMPDHTLTWRRFADTYKSGVRAECAGTLRAAELLTAGFRKLYCLDAPDLVHQIGSPRVPEAKAFIQFQRWSGGLLIFGVPATGVGISGPEHKFTRLSGFFLADEEENSSGLARQVSWTEGTNDDDDACSALWYRVVDGKESPLLSQRCSTNIAHVDRLVHGQLRCEPIGPQPRL